MTTYKVWIEIEAYDNETESGELIDACSFASTAEFRSLDEATRFAERLNECGDRIVTEYDTTIVVDKG